MHDIFVSYSRKDAGIVSQYVAFLEKHGLSVWIDRNGIYSGDAFKQVIAHAIGESDIFLFFSSVNSNASQWTEKEIGVAVHKKKKIIPVKLDDSEFSEAVLFDLVNLDFVTHNGRVDECGGILLKSIMRNRQVETPRVILLGKPQSGKTSLALYMAHLLPENGMKFKGNFNLSMSEIIDDETVIGGKARNVWHKKIALPDYKSIDLYDVGYLEHDICHIMSLLNPDCAIVTAYYERNGGTWEMGIDMQSLESAVKMAKECGIKKIIPLINKLDMNDDDDAVGRSEALFNALLAKYGYQRCSGPMSGSVLGALGGVPEWEYKLEYIIAELGKLK